MDQFIYTLISKKKMMSKMYVKYTTSCFSGKTRSAVRHARYVIFRHIKENVETYTVYFNSNTICNGVAGSFFLHLLQELMPNKVVVKS